MGSAGSAATVGGASLHRDLRLVEAPGVAKTAAAALSTMFCSGWGAARGAGGGVLVAAAEASMCGGEASVLDGAVFAVVGASPAGATA